MRADPNWLDRLPKLSPIDGLDTQQIPDRFRRLSRQSKQARLIISGAGVTLVCGSILMWCIGLASFPPPAESANWPVTVVLSRTFGLEEGGRVTIPALLGLLGGLVLLVSGFYSIGKPEP
jgi:hypothetical protein